MSLFIASCGDSSDPTAVTNLELKSPSGLKIIDKGQGKLTLTWFTSNPEDAFEGYNIYGAAITDAELTTIGVTKGQPIKLLSSDGTPVDAVKTTILPKFDYTTANTNALPGAGAPLSADKEETELSKLPINARNPADAADPLLPTCRPASGTCTLNTSTTKPSGITSNGVVKFDLGATMQLTEGKQYCFFVLAVQNDGKEVSASSTEVVCAYPRFKATFARTVSGNNFTDLRAALATCTTTTHACTAPTFVTTASGNLNLQSNSLGDTFIQGRNGGAVFVARMGAFPGGFDTFFDKAEVFVNDDTGVEHGGGYANSGQSVQLEPYGIYAIAIGQTATDTDSAKFAYSYLWVNSSTTSSSQEINFELRMSNVLTER